MSNFYMLAGTVASDRSLEQLRQLLTKGPLKVAIVDDELTLRGHANIYLRPGFSHEYILVGDALDGDTLLKEAGKISSLLSEHGIQHAFEIYDRRNEQIFDYEYTV